MTRCLLISIPRATKPWKITQRYSLLLTWASLFLCTFMQIIKKYNQQRGDFNRLEPDRVKSSLMNDEWWHNHLIKCIRESFRKLFGHIWYFPDFTTAWKLLSSPSCSISRPFLSELPYPQQAEKLKSREMMEEWMKNDKGWMKNDEWWKMNDKEWWF